MRKQKRTTEIFNLSFLDIVTCGFGAMILLLIIVKPVPVESIINDDSEAIIEAIGKLSLEVADLRNLHSTLGAQDKSKSDAETSDAMVLRKSAEVEDAARKLRLIQEENEALEIALESLKKATIRVPATPEKRDVEVGGIPVDSQYVILIIDNSGSMLDIWPRVTRTIDHILDVHPTVRGFQVMNDNGWYLIPSTKGKWIPDNPRRRKFVRQQLQNWLAFSNSSPAEGLERALRTYARRYEKISIYVLGDEFTGSSYDDVVSSVRSLNTERGKQKPLVRIHGIGFISLLSTERYAALMRFVTERNRGAFIGLPVK